jgi:EAL domain-containing protein (putative c-di-GMP-specific phosphodiesterase class I)
MYKAKQYKNSYKFYRSLTDEKIEAQLNSERNLYLAINRKEFTLFYQPVIDTSSLEIRSLEALARWRHPEAGIVLPDAFLPIAESTGLIFRLGKWVMRQAFLQSATWQKNGYLAKISINISNRQIQDKGFPLVINRILKETDADPENIMIEIAETYITENDDITANNLKKLKDFGFEISIDNFGTGFSSLSFLNDLPVNTLKIDGSLISDISADSTSSAIINAIIDMAHDLRFGVIAKGVETTAQNQLLRRLKCDQQQGYLFSPAVTSDEARRLLELKTFPLNAINQSVDAMIH